jgi:RNA polymerase sigma-70 factor (ECF subfamily)
MIMTLSKRQSRIIGAETSTTDFETLFEEHWNRLCGVLNRMLGDPQEAEDLALEAFVQLHHHPPADDRNLGGWLYRVAVNLGFNALRARKRRQHYEEQAGSLAMDDSSPEDPAKTAERRLESEQVRATLGTMKPRTAQVLILRYSGLSYAEIAAATGVSPGSIGTLLARAEKEFEKLYGKGW